MIDESYRTLQGMNQSLLKEILKSPQAFLKTQKRYAEPGNSEEEHFVFGSMVDHLLTESTPLEDKFYFMEATKASDAIKAIVKDIFDFVLETYSNPIKDLNEVEDKDILQIIKYHGYQNKWKDDTKVAAIRRDGDDYFKSLLASNGKIIVPVEEKNKAIICKAALLSDPITKKYFTVEKGEIEIIYKFVLEYEFNGIPMKGEMDMVVINHTTRTIIPIDIKTVGDSVYSFPYNFWRYRYDFQAASYRVGLEKCKKGVEWLSKGYTISAFTFIVVEKECINPPC
jgi:hypothetical protein